MFAPDLLTEAEHLLTQQGVAEGVIERVIHELRLRYGGDRPFIRKLDRDQRNQGIAADLAAGLPVEMVAHRRSCSPRTVRSVRHQRGLIRFTPSPSPASAGSIFF